MKKILPILLTLVTALSFQSCKNEKTEPLSSSSPDGKMTIEVVGEKIATGDPYTVTVTLDHENDKLDDAISTEIYAQQLDSSNVQFNWTSGMKCIITITEQDGKIRSIPVSAGVISQ